MLRAILIVVIASITASSCALAADPLAGETIFRAKKCTMCHKIVAPDASAEIDTTGPPNLQFVGDRRNAEWMSKFLKKEIDNAGRKHKTLFKGSPEDLATLTEWLSSLRSQSLKVDSLIHDITDPNAVTTPEVKSK